MFRTKFSCFPSETNSPVPRLDSLSARPALPAFGRGLADFADYVIVFSTAREAAKPHNTSDQKLAGHHSVRTP